MTGPVTLPSPDRLNAGPYRVTVYLPGEAEQMNRADWGEFFKKIEPLETRPPSFEHLGSPFVFGTVTPDGSLSVEPEPWAARHYRRAVMQGAGVYRWGLWAMLTPGRAAAEPDAQAGAALNGAAQLDGFSPWAFISRPDAVLLQTQGSDAFFKRLGLWLDISRPNTKEIVNVCLESERLFSDQEMARFALCVSLHASKIGIDPTKYTVDFLNLLLGPKVLTRSQRAAIWAVYRAVINVQRRIARIVKPRRAPRRAPRPLHAQPRPPAAPLAPPALA